MGTFHHDRGELHGITVVVDTTGSRIYIGRCDTMDEQSIVLLDADVHDAQPGGRSKSEYVQRAVQVGIWKRHDRLVLPMTEVASVRRLGELG